MAFNLTNGGKPLRQLYTMLALALLVVQILAVLCALTQPAYAYIDPGSGLLAVQIVSSTFAGIIFMLRRRLRLLVREVSGRFGSKAEKINR